MVTATKCYVVDNSAKFILEIARVVGLDDAKGDDDDVADAGEDDEWSLSVCMILQIHIETWF